CPSTTESHPWSCHLPKTGRATSASTDSGGLSSTRAGCPSPDSQTSLPAGRRLFSSPWAASTPAPGVIRPSPISCAPPLTASSCRGRPVLPSPRRPRTGSSPPVMYPIPGCCRRWRWPCTRPVPGSPRRACVPGPRVCRSHSTPTSSSGRAGRTRSGPRRLRSKARRALPKGSPLGWTRSSETQGSPAGRHRSGPGSRTVTARRRCVGGRPSMMAEGTAAEGDSRDDGRIGRPARLSRSSIVRTAIDLADHSGLDAVTMRAVAAELDSVAAALYRHVQGRDELIDLIRDEVLAERPEASETGEWRADLRDFVGGLLAIHEAHPWLATGGLPSRLGPRTLATTETAMSLLSPHPAGRDQKYSAIAV